MKADHAQTNPSAPRNPAQRGFTYLGVLFIIAVMGVGLAAVGVVWKKVEQRAKEQELLFIGDQLRHAIGWYYERTPNGPKAYPKTLEHLLQDNRHVNTQRHLRKIYRDPMTGTTDWGLVTQPDGGIVGVYSLSDAAPTKVAGFTDENAAFTTAQHYSDWKFIFVPIRPSAPITPHPVSAPSAGQVSGHAPEPEQGQSGR